MTYQEFLSELSKEVSRRLPGEFRVTLRTVIKNNGVKFTGMSVRKEGETLSKSPVIYPERLYREFNEELTMEEIAEEAARALLTPVPSGISEKSLCDPEYVRTHIVLKLLGKENNEEYLKDAVTEDWLDLALCYGVLLPDNDAPGGMVMLTKGLAEEAGLSGEEIRPLALENTKALFGDTLRSIDQVLFSEYGEDIACPEGESMYVLSNRQNWYGAAAILYTDKVRELAEREGMDLYILPSSIHELILTPKKDKSDDALKEIIREVNDMEKSREEILTDSLYLYSLEKDCVMLCC